MMVLVVLWALVLGVCTCTYSIDALLFHQVVAFHWTWHPDFRELLITSDAHPMDPGWLFIKAGHFIGFSILDMLLYRWWRHRKAAMVGALSYAIFTEILQLFFLRDGRLLDMAIDSAGILCAYLMMKHNHKGVE